jgi:hypothetical protein
MVIKIAGRDIDDNWTDWAVMYPDGELVEVFDEETARDIVRAAKMVGAKYKVMKRLVFVTGWEKA